MIALHGQSFVGPASTLSKPFMESQSVKTCDAYIDPICNGSGTMAGSGSRTAGVDDASQRISSTPFKPYIRNQAFFDKNLTQGY